MKQFISKIRDDLQFVLLLSCFVGHPVYPVCLVGSKYCCKGYCMDLLEKLAQKCNFTYDVYLSLGKLYTVTGYIKGLFASLITEPKK